MAIHRKDAEDAKAAPRNLRLFRGHILLFVAQRTRVNVGIALGPQVRIGLETRGVNVHRYGCIPGNSMKTVYRT